MNTFFALLLVLAVLALIAAAMWSLVKTVSRDGLGHRPAPRSHHSELDVSSPRWWIDVWSGADPWQRGGYQPHH